MKNFTLIIFALATLYLLFRDRLPKVKNIYDLKAYFPIFSRFAYLILAWLWWYLNEEQLIFSLWDANRLSLPINLYHAIPTIVLFFYAALPSYLTWAIVVCTFSGGVLLHAHKSVINAKFVEYGNMQSIGIVTETIFILVIGIVVFYYLGPYVRKRYGQSKNLL